MTYEDELGSFLEELKERKENGRDYTAKQYAGSWSQQQVMWQLHSAWENIARTRGGTGKVGAEYGPDSTESQGKRLHPI